MLGENDAPSMLSYAATGAKYGIGMFVPLVAATFLLAYVVQEMTVRAGIATGRGLAQLIGDRLGARWSVTVAVAVVVGNFLTLVTEFIGIRTGLDYFGVPPLVAVGTVVALTAGAVASGRYWTWEKLTLSLAALNLVFVPFALAAAPRWGRVAQSLATWHPLPGGPVSSVMLLIVSDLGATVTPWMLFFQQSAVADKGLRLHDMRQGRLDTAVGAVVAAVCGIAVVAGTSVLAGHRRVLTLLNGARFADALVPHAGRLASTLFAIGITEAGMVAVMVISTTTGYVLTEVTPARSTVDMASGRLGQFHWIVIGSAAAAGAIVLVPGLPLLGVVLAVNVVAVVSMPPVLVLLNRFTADSSVMGALHSTPRQRTAGAAVTAAVVAASLALGASFFAPLF